MASRSKPLSRRFHETIDPTAAPTLGEFMKLWTGRPCRQTDNVVSDCSLNNRAERTGSATAASVGLLADAPALLLGLSQA